MKIVNKNNGIEVKENDLLFAAKHRNNDVFKILHKEKQKQKNVNK